MATVNEKLQDDSIRHNINTQAYSNYQVRRMLTILNKVDLDLTIELRKALEKAPKTLNVQRLDNLLKSVKSLNQEAYTQLYDALSAEMKDLTEYESQYQLNLFKATIPVELSYATIATQQVYSATLARPFQGRILKGWASSLEEGKLQHIKDAIAIGYVENEPVDQIVRRVVGTKALNYKDGLLQIDRNHAEAVVRTAISHFSNYARDSFFEANASVIKGYKYTATLDSRTTLLCSSRDGNFYPIGASKPAIPAHFNCRSVYIGVVKSFKELGLDADEFPASTRSSIDGQVPDNVTYQAWLKTKPASFQDEVLGKTKGKLFRDGGLTLDRFVSKKGHEYTLDELRARDKEAFSKAGL